MAFDLALLVDGPRLWTWLAATGAADQVIEQPFCAWLKIHCFALAAALIAEALVTGDRCATWRPFPASHRWLLALAAALTILYLADHQADWYREDGPFETLTAIGSALAGWLLLRRTRRTTDRERSALLVAGLLLLVFAAEEISWGQRIFGFSTPPPLATLNAQGETNLHNLFNHWAHAAHPTGLLLLGYWLIRAAAGRPAWPPGLGEHGRRWWAGWRLVWWFGLLFLLQVPLAVYRGSELAEQLVALFALAWATGLPVRPEPADRGSPPLDTAGAVDYG